MDKKQQILTAAVTLFAAEGVSVPTSRIAKAAGVSNGTLFNHFETKQALIDALYFSIKSRLVEALLAREDCQNMHFHDILLSIWRYYTHWAIENPKEMTVIGMLRSAQLISQEMFETTDKLFEFVTVALERGLANGDLYPAPIDLICELGCAQMQAVVAYAQKQNLDSEGLESVIETAFTMYWQGISNPTTKN